MLSPAKERKRPMSRTKKTDVSSDRRHNDARQLVVTVQGRDGHPYTDTQTHSVVSANNERGSQVVFDSQNGNVSSSEGEGGHLSIDPHHGSASLSSQVQ